MYLERTLHVLVIEELDQARLKSQMGEKIFEHADKPVPERAWRRDGRGRCVQDRELTVPPLELGLLVPAAFHLFERPVSHLAVQTDLVDKGGDVLYCDQRPPHPLIKADRGHRHVLLLPPPSRECDRDQVGVELG